MKFIFLNERLIQSIFEYPYFLPGENVTYHIVYLINM